MGDRTSAHGGCIRAANTWDFSRADASVAKSPWGQIGLLLASSDTLASQRLALKVQACANATVRGPSRGLSSEAWGCKAPSVSVNKSVTSLRIRKAQKGR